MIISVVIPSYNAAPYIERAILSILNQTIAVQEIIVVDDGSTDQTVEVINQFKAEYPIISLIEQQKNAGASAARNAGFAKAKGDWILLLDADDECEASLVEYYHNKINHNTYNAIYSQFMQIDELGRKISNPFTGQELLGKEGFCQMFLRNPIISPSGSIISKMAYQQLGGFDTSIKYVEDVDFWLRLLSSGMNIGYIAQPLSLIRRHSNNTTANIESTRQGEKRLLDKFGISVLRENIYARSHSMLDNHFDYIQFLIRFDRWEEAKDLLTSLHITPSYSRYISFLFIKALISLYFDQWPEANQLYSEIVAMDEAHGASLNNIGVIYAMNHDLENARTSFQSAISHYPEYLDAKYNLEQLETGNASYRFTKRELRKNLLRYS